MKRHPDLREFSDDHHQGLVNALRLKRAADGEGVAPMEAARSFLKFWREDTSLHFRKEEEVLLPVVARYGGNLGDECVVVMLVPNTPVSGASSCNSGTGWSEKKVAWRPGALFNETCAAAGARSIGFPAEQDRLYGSGQVMRPPVWPPVWPRPPGARVRDPTPSA